MKPRASFQQLQDRLQTRYQVTIDHLAESAREWGDLREERRLLAMARAGRDVCWPDGAESEPLVTVRIATYNRGSVVAERALASAVAQTYQRLEILVIGDCCDERTARAVRSVRDSRIRFVNLPTRGLYPENPSWRRKVAGSHPMNVARHLAEGQWIAPCDDDDEMTPDHVEVLLRHAVGHRCEMVYSKAHFEESPGSWRTVGSRPLRMGDISHGSVLYSSGLRFMAHSNTSYKLHEPSDWNLWKRMEKIGVKVGFLDRVTYTLNLPAAQREG